jgi:MFS family permease
VLTCYRKLNPLLVHAASCFAAALFIFLFWPLVQQESHVVAFCVLVGILGGALFGLPASSMAFLLPPDFNDRLGVWTGMMLGLSSISVIGPPVSGALVRRYGIISVGLWAGASLIVAGGLVAVAMRKRFTEEKKSAGNSPQLEGDIEGSIHEFHTARSGSWGA